MDMVNLYDANNSWLPTSRPNPQVQREPFEQLNNSLPRLEMSRANGRLWQNIECERYLMLPENPTPTAFNPTIQNEEAIINILQEVPLYLLLDEQISATTETENVVIPDAPIPQIDRLSIEPAVTFPNPGFYGNLKENTQSFYHETLLIDPPLNEIPDWRRGTQSINIAPPINLQIR
jgi:hypothetical protein